MFIQSFCKNNYKLSNRNYLDDYSNIITKEIDMTMSGRYLTEYPKLDIDLKELDKYPLNTYAEELKKVIAEKNNIKNDIIIGSGANGILQNLAKLYLGKGENLIVPFYTFNQLEYAATTLKAHTKRVYMNEEKINFTNIIKSIDQKTKLIYICNPNNPTGVYIESYKLLEFSKIVKKINKNVKLIIDESTIEFTNKESILDYKLPRNMIVVRTLSKAYGAANLRVGYMVCNNDVYKEYVKNTTTNELSSIICKLAINILKSNLYKENVKLVLRQRDFLQNELKNIGIETYNSNSNILLTKTTFTKSEIDNIEKNNISVVKVKDKNDRIHIRIAIQDEYTNKAFINKLKKIISKNRENL